MNKHFYLIITMAACLVGSAQTKCWWPSWMTKANAKGAAQQIYSFAKGALAGSAAAALTTTAFSFAGDAVGLWKEGKNPFYIYTSYSGVSSKSDYISNQLAPVALYGVLMAGAWACKKVYDKVQGNQPQPDDNTTAQAAGFLTGIGAVACHIFPMVASKTFCYKITQKP